MGAFYKQYSISSQGDQEIPLMQLELSNSVLGNKLLMIVRDTDASDITATVAMSQMLHGSDSLKGLLEPALVKFEDKSYSLEPDIANGWRPRRKVYRQIPLRYHYQPVELIIKQYTKFGAPQEYRVIYMGPRYTSNLKLMKAHCWKQYDSNSKQALLYDLPRLKKFNFSYIREREKDFNNQIQDQRLFNGMNPTLEENGLMFDSDFQCGNLDLVMKISEKEYDLFMRVDSNTRGHNSWFFFKVRNTRANQAVKFNLCNFHRTSSLFMSGMRPSVFSKINGKGWTHQGTNITYSRKPLRYPINEGKQLLCLSFQYVFENDFDDVYFAYSVPYSYSYLLNFLDELSNEADSKQCLKISYHLESPGGLPIPLLTISNPSDQESGNQTKKTVLVTGRMHPGQTQGSWTIHGFVRFLCSNAAKTIRDTIIFKIMPMVNVDGVVGGNFRTGLLGLDLNRLFRVQTIEKYYEVQYIKEIATAYRNQILMYLDFHGHSTKKNIFIYGPDYKLVDSHYLLSRILPKTISKLTQTFRYYSCIFKVSRAKEKTARAVMLRQYSIPYCYTIEASAYCYTKLAAEVPFTSQIFIESGTKIAMSLQKFVDVLNKIDVKREEIKRQKKQAREVREMKIQMYKEIQFIKIKKRSDSRAKNLNKSQRRSKSSQPSYLKGITELEELFEQIKKDQQMLDAQSEGDSDCQNEEDDYPITEQDKFLKQRKSNKKAKVQVLASAMTKKGPQNLDIKITQQRMVSPPPNQRVIIRDFVEQQRLANKNLIKTRARNNDESLPEIKSSRPKRIYDSLHSQRLYSRASRDKSGHWISNAIRQPIREQLTTHVNMLKMETIQSRKSQPFDADEYENKVVMKQQCIINLKIDDSGEEDLMQQKRQQPPTIQPIPRKFLDIYQSLRKQEPIVTCKRRKLEIIELKPEVPDIISQILKKHLNSPGHKKNTLQRSIQVIRL